MIQQVSITDFIKASMVQQQLHMPLQLFTVQECRLQPLHHQLFFWGQCIGVFWVNGRKMRIQQGKRLSFIFDCSGFVVNQMQ